MSTFWAVVIAFIAGETLGVIVMAVLSGSVDKWLDQKQKKNGR